jgi:aldose 1-epimerase
VGARFQRARGKRHVENVPPQLRPTPKKTLTGDQIIELTVPFQVETYPHFFPFRPAPSAVWRLSDPATGASATIAPEFGCNCFDWKAGPAGQTPLLYADPQVFPDGRPTRSGIPVLFPYPNRIRGGKFTWEGVKYQLPLSDSTGLHSIHGFACRRPWRVLASGANEISAWLTAEFHCAVDSPENLASWPADHLLQLTFRLGANVLRLEAVVKNPSTRSLPFGLGFHPYFHRPSPQTLVQAPARAFWELHDNLPTGKVLPVNPSRDLNSPRPAGELQLDDVLTELPGDRANAEGLLFRGQIGQLELWTSPAFRELVAFTPPHRQAVCLEPYTCTTDAANLATQGIDGGWLTLGPGLDWSGVFEMVVKE